MIWFVKIVDVINNNFNHRRASSNLKDGRWRKRWSAETCQLFLHNRRVFNVRILYFLDYKSRLGQVLANENIPFDSTRCRSTTSEWCYSTNKWYYALYFWLKVEKGIPSQNWKYSIKSNLYQKHSDDVKNILGRKAKKRLQENQTFNLWLKASRTEELIYRWYISGMMMI